MKKPSLVLSRRCLRFHLLMLKLIEEMKTLSYQILIRKLRICSIDSPFDTITFSPKLQLQPSLLFSALSEASSDKMFAFFDSARKVEAQGSSEWLEREKGHSLLAWLSLFLDLRFRQFFLRPESKFSASTNPCSQRGLIARKWISLGENPKAVLMQKIIDSCDDLPESLFDFSKMTKQVKVLDILPANLLMMKCLLNLNKKYEVRSKEDFRSYVKKRVMALSAELQPSKMIYSIAAQPLRKSIEIESLILTKLVKLLKELCTSDFLEIEASAKQRIRRNFLRLGSDYCLTSSMIERLQKNRSDLELEKTSESGPFFETLSGRGFIDKIGPAAQSSGVSETKSFPEILNSFHANSETSSDVVTKPDSKTKLDNFDFSLYEQSKISSRQIFIESIQLMLHQNLSDKNFNFFSRWNLKTQSDDVSSSFLLPHSRSFMRTSPISKQTAIAPKKRPDPLNEKSDLNSKKLSKKSSAVAFPEEKFLSGPVDTKKRGRRDKNDRKKPADINESLSISFQGSVEEIDCHKPSSSPASNSSFKSAPVNASPPPSFAHKPNYSSVPKNPHSEDSEPIHRKHSEKIDYSSPTKPLIAIDTFHLQKFTMKLTNQIDKSKSKNVDHQEKPNKLSRRGLAQSNAEYDKVHISQFPKVDSLKEAKKPSRLARVLTNEGSKPNKSFIHHKPTFVEKLASVAQEKNSSKISPQESEKDSKTKKPSKKILTWNSDDEQLKNIEKNSKVETLSDFNGERKQSDKPFAHEDHFLRSNHLSPEIVKNNLSFSDNSNSFSETSSCSSSVNNEDIDLQSKELRSLRQRIKLIKPISKIEEFVIPGASLKERIDKLFCKELEKQILRISEALTTNATVKEESRKVVKERLQLIVNEIFGDEVELFAFGSFITRLVTPFSDIDLGLRVSDSSSNLPQSNIEMLKIFASSLEKHDFVEKVNSVLSASIPVVKIEANSFTPFRDTKCSSSSQKIKCDVIINSDDVFKNEHTSTRTTNYIVDAKTRFPSFFHNVLIIKYMLNCLDMASSYRGGLNSYGLCLIYIAFLKANSLENEPNFGFCFERFLAFLSKFDWMNLGIFISPHSKCVISRSWFQGSDFGQLIVIDPTDFSQKNVTSTCNSFPAIQTIAGEIVSEFSKIKKNVAKDLEGLSKGENEIEAAISKKLEESLGGQAAEDSKLFHILRLIKFQN